MPQVGQALLRNTGLRPHVALAALPADEAHASPEKDARGALFAFSYFSATPSVTFITVFMEWKQ